MAIVSPLVGQPWDDTQYRRAHGASAEGIVRDDNGTSFKATIDVSTSTITLGPGEAEIQGFNFYETGNTTLRLTDFGTVPTSGQTRYDHVVLQYDPTNSASPVKIVVKPGTPAGNPATGPLRTRAGVWEIPLHYVTYGKTNSGSVQISVTDRRMWTGPNFVQPDNLSGAGAASPATTFPGPWYLGTTITQGEQRWTRVLKAGIPTWQPSLPQFPQRFTGTITGPWSNPIYDVYFRQLGRLVIPDPGYTYFLRLDAQTVAYMAPNATDGRVDVTAAVGGSDAGSGATVGIQGYGGGDILASTDGRFGGDLHHLNGMSARTYTGSQTIYLRGIKPYGTGAWVTSTAAFIMTAEIVRAA